MQDLHSGNLLPVYNAVRCVGTIEPTFDSKSSGFMPPELNVSGTGFWIKKYNCFITCAHVVKDMFGRSIEIAGMLVMGGNGFPYQRMTITIVDWQHDLAILSPYEDNQGVLKQIEQGLVLADNDPCVAETIAYAGFPFGKGLLDPQHTPTYAEGVVGKTVYHDKERTYVQCSGPVVGGYSGSPIVLKSNPALLIGVLANGPVDDGNTGNIFKAVHFAHVKALCELVQS